MLVSFSLAGAGKMPTYFDLNREYSNAASVDTANNTLSNFRELDIKIAKNNKTGFADIRQRMKKVNFDAKVVLGKAYRIGGKDGIHLGPNSHLIIAYEILRPLKSFPSFSILYSLFLNSMLNVRCSKTFLKFFQSFFGCGGSTPFAVLGSLLEDRFCFRAFDLSEEVTGGHSYRIVLILV